MNKLKPNQITTNKAGETVIRGRFRTSKHKGYYKGAFGRQSKNY